jgi:hypothetical protein
MTFSIGFVTDTSLSDRPTTTQGKPFSWPVGIRGTKTSRLLIRSVIPRNTVTMAALTQSLTFTGQRVVSRAQQAPKRASVTTKAALKHADELLETAVRETLVSANLRNRPRSRSFSPSRAECRR